MYGSYDAMKASHGRAMAACSSTASSAVTHAASQRYISVCDARNTRRRLAPSRSRRVSPRSPPKASPARKTPRMIANVCARDFTMFSTTRNASTSQAMPVSPAANAWPSHPSHQDGAGAVSAARATAVAAGAVAGAAGCQRLRYRPPRVHSTFRLAPKRTAPSKPQCAASTNTVSTADTAPPSVLA